MYPPPAPPPAPAAAATQVAIKNEVLVAVSNRNYAWPGGMLQTWVENVRRAGRGWCVWVWGVPQGCRECGALPLPLRPPRPCRRHRLVPAPFHLPRPLTRPPTCLGRLLLPGPRHRPHLPTHTPAETLTPQCTHTPKRTRTPHPQA